MIGKARRGAHLLGLVPHASAFEHLHRARGLFGTRIGVLAHVGIADRCLPMHELDTAVRRRKAARQEFPQWSVEVGCPGPRWAEVRFPALIHINYAKRFSGKGNMSRRHGPAESTARHGAPCRLAGRLGSTQPHVGRSIVKTLSTSTNPR